MSTLRLEALREKLLRAGIAPRHVRLYLGELRQHFDDLLRAETAGGLSGEAAFAAARTRLGSDDSLAAAMLARPELRSLATRFPWAVFGLAPVAALALLIVAATLVKAGLMKISHGEGVPPPDWIKSFVAAWDWSAMYAFPAAVAALFFCLGARQFILTRWLILGAVVIAVLGATVTCGTLFSNLPHKSAITVGLGFRSQTDMPRLAANLALVGVMSLFYWFWLRRQTAQSSA